MLAKKDIERFPDQIFTTMEDEEMKQELRAFKKEWDKPEFWKTDWKNPRTYQMEVWDDSINFDSEITVEDVTDEESSDMEIDES